MFFRAAIAGLRLGVVHLDLPIALGIALAFAGSVWAHVAHGPRAAYFDTVAIFVTLMLVGRFLQERVLERNRAALLASDGVEGLLVRRVRGGELETVPASGSAAGDELLGRPRRPRAGRRRSSSARPARSRSTGSPASPRCARWRRATTVPAGAFNAGAHGAARRRGRGVRRLAPARADRRRPAGDGRTRPLGPAASWWRRLGTIYVVAVLALATLGLRRLAAARARAGAPGDGGDPRRHLPVRPRSRLPLARELTHGRRCGAPGCSSASRASSTVRCAVRTVLFDKTGTLTRGTA